MTLEGQRCPSGDSEVMRREKVPFVFNVFPWYVNCAVYGGTTQYQRGTERWFALRLMNAQWA